MITFTVEGMADLLNSFGKVERGILDLRQLGTWDWVQSEFYKVETQIFASEGGKSKWAALKPSYAAAKSKIWGNQPILHASGRGMKSLTAAGGDSIVDKQAQELTLGSSLAYMGYHHTGTSKMPRRDPIDFTEAQEKQIVEPINKKLKQLIDNARLRDIRGF